MDSIQKIGDWVQDKGHFLDFEYHVKAAARKTKPNYGGVRIPARERVGAFKHIWVMRGFLMTGVKRRRLGDRDIIEITQETTRNRILRYNPGL